jgi:hypothetical protein
MIGDEEEEQAEMSQGPDTDEMIEMARKIKGLGLHYWHVYRDGEHCVGVRLRPKSYTIVDGYSRRSAGDALKQAYESLLDFHNWDYENREEVAGEIAELQERIRAEQSYIELQSAPDTQAMADEYEEKLAGLMLRAAERRITRTQFTRQMMVLVADNAEQLFRLGAKIEDDDNLSTNERAAFEKELANQLESVSSLADDIYSKEPI